VVKLSTMTTQNTDLSTPTPRACAGPACRGAPAQGHMIHRAEVDGRVIGAGNPDEDGVVLSPSPLSDCTSRPGPRHAHAWPAVGAFCGMSLEATRAGASAPTAKHRVREFRGNAPL
jgi:hypothetical protein